MEEVDTNVDYDTATENMGKLFTQYKEYITDSTNHRQHFQRELAVVRAKEGKHSISTEVLNQERKEAQRVSAARIRRMNGMARSSNGINLVIIPTDEGPPVELSTKEPVENALLSFYENKITSSNTKPFM